MGFWVLGNGGNGGQILSISAKTGLGVEAVLQRIVESIPAPEGNLEGKLRALVFDGYFDAFRGVVSLVAVIDGEICLGMVQESSA